MYYTVYKITNLINDKIYIGVHKTEDINDDYMGSGKILKRAQEKYGIENFKKEILEVFNNAEDMFNMESQLVNEKFLERKDVYNLALGGSGGDLAKFIDYVKRNTNEEWLLKCKTNLKKGNETLEMLKKDPIWYKIYYEKVSKGVKEYYENGGINGFKNKKHTEETKKKIGKINSVKQKGNKNSQFGTMWIHNLEEKLSKKIKKEEFPKYEKIGWLKGRKMKF